MSAEYVSKHGDISRPPSELYMSFTDMRNFAAMLPEEKRQGVKAGFDSISFEIQNFSVGVKVDGRFPYSKIVYVDDGAPFRFKVTLFFDEGREPSRTDFHIEVEAELNLMMKMMLGSKIKEGMDKIIDAMEDPTRFASEFKF
ncbi:MAG: SRPBCC family protein [Bacteroidales bacterium]|nr:SRPBCC family protein [Bacteroidales bacterium]